MLTCVSALPLRSLLLGALGAAVVVGSALPDAPGPQPLGEVPRAIAASGAKTNSQTATRATAPVSRSEVNSNDTRVTAPYRVRAKACRTGRVVLTFDDGPHPQRTGELRRWLTRNDIPATFFVVGSRVSSAPGVLRALGKNQRLFTLANHTWRHPDLRAIPAAQVRGSLAATQRAVAAHGPASPLMRPPYGAVTPRVHAAIRAEGLVPVFWNVDSEDWRGGNRHQIAARILAQLRPKRANIVLQHDGINNSFESVRAVPIVVAQAKKRGYCFVPLNDNGQAGSMLARSR